MVFGLEPRMYVLSVDDIVAGRATDIYFVRTKYILERSGLCNKVVRYELHTYGLPKGYEWAVFAGLEEVLALLKGRRIRVYSLPEGTLYRPLYPLMVIEGEVCEIVHLETAILGILRFYTSVATKAARIKAVARDRKVLFFGLRAQHPAIAPALDRAAYIGGVDAVSGAFSEEFIGVKPQGTMPHVLILVFGDPSKAWKAFDEYMPPEVPRIALVDTMYDERFESELAVKTLGKKLWGIRLDTPRSRRGDMRLLVEEIRWYLKLLGYENIKVVVSGGIDEESIEKLRDVVDAFGVGTAIAMPKPIDISMDIVEIFDEDQGAWKPVSKRGKLPGMKQVYRCIPVIEDYIDRPGKHVVCRDGSEAKPLLELYLDNGELVKELPSVENIRRYVLDQLKVLEEHRQQSI